MIKNSGWCVSLAGLGVKLTLGILSTWTIFKPEENRSMLNQVRERITFARAQPVDVYLGARHL